MSDFQIAIRSNSSSTSKFKLGSIFKGFDDRGSRNHHLLSENCDFSGTEPPLDLRPVCKFKFVRCGPVVKNRALYLSRFKPWRPDEVREHLFPNSKIEIFINFCRFSTNFPNFKKISGDQFKS